MSDNSRHSSLGYSTHASGYSLESSSSFISDGSFSNQHFFAAQQFRGESTSGSASSALLHLDAGRRRRRLTERPSLFTSFPKEYYTKDVKCHDIYISPRFKVQELEEDIQKVIQGQTIIYPKSVERTTNEKLKQVVQTIKLYHKRKGAFIYVGSSLMVLFNQQFYNLQKCTDNVVCDICTFSLGGPAFILTVVEDDKNGHLLKDYNALLAQEVHTSVRKDVVGLRACNGVIELGDCNSIERFENELKIVRERDKVLPTYLHKENLDETVFAFLKMIAKCSGSDGEESYLVGRMFLDFIELMQESHNVLVKSSSFHFTITLLCEMVHRLVLAGKISLVVKGFDVIQELHELGKRHTNSILLMYEQPSNSKDMQNGDICLTSVWTRDQKWIFKTGPRRAVQHPRLMSPRHDAPITEGMVEAVKSRFENMN